MFKARFNGPPSQNILIKQRGNNALLYGKMMMPQKFNPSDGSSSFSNARHVYNNYAYNNNSGFTPSNKERMFSGCNNDQSGYIQRKKMNAVGKSSMVRTEEISFRSNDINVVNRRLQRCRSGGCVAPPKKGAIANTFKSGGSSNLTGTGNATITPLRDF